MASCVCVLTSEGSIDVNGTLTFSQASETAPTIIKGQLRGLTAKQKHGIQICTYGDLSAAGASCGPIFNPFGKTHGAPSDDPSQRMVGDIGNVEGDETGACTVSIEDKVVKLIGPHSVIGRSLVICAGEDDGGKGGQEKSLETGNAGPRIAYGVIGLAKS
eukprot:CAMPEP_0119562388 /NCGR_PEP_ID=MMETSP1352-20130426/20285_1 /TAXON_ID=265584 /ORGANISM="Stauroneis constricta, Strain CCMP1120" /LENGTH=159 /DNA_ID=CAMNT_0007610781 /DNA_START=17 /DNA_END=496 /DNA_ORIENTATION=-